MAARTPHDVLEAEGIWPRPKAREKIYNFEDEAGDRMGRVLARIVEIPDGPGLAAELAGCRQRGYPCGTPRAACRVCDRRSIQISRDVKARFSDIVYTRPELVPLKFLVAISENLQMPVGQLIRFEGYNFIRTIAQRLRRADFHALIALDVCLVEAIDFRGVVVRIYWAPHYNLLVPARELDQVKATLENLCPDGKFIPTPLLARDVDDPWIAANYAAKFDLSAVRLRKQFQRETDGNFLLEKRHFRLPDYAFTEFLEWRSMFDPQELFTSVKLGWK